MTKAKIKLQIRIARALLDFGDDEAEIQKNKKRTKYELERLLRTRSRRS